MPRLPPNEATFKIGARDKQLVQTYATVLVGSSFLHPLVLLCLVLECFNQLMDTLEAKMKIYGLRHGWQWIQSGI